MCFVPIPKFGCPWFGLGKCCGAKKTDTSSLVVPIFSSSLPFFSSLSSTSAPCLVDSAATVERRYHRCSSSVDDETGSTVGAAAAPVVRAAMLVGAPAARTARVARPLALWAVEAAAAPVTTAAQAGPFATPSSPLMAMACATFLDPAGPQFAAFLDPGEWEPALAAEAVSARRTYATAVSREVRAMSQRWRSELLSRPQPTSHGGIRLVGQKHIISISHTLLIFLSLKPIVGSDLMHFPFPCPTYHNPQSKRHN
jgi:hypothetical protein